MQQLILLIHIFACITLISLVLMQHGKGADAGAALGSGASQTVFGSRGATSFIVRVTVCVAVVFFVTSLILGYFAAHQPRISDRITILAQQASEVVGKDKK